MGKSSKILNIYLRTPSKSNLKKPVIVVQFRSGRQKSTTLNCDEQTAQFILRKMRNELELGTLTLDDYFGSVKTRRATLGEFTDSYIADRESQAKRHQLSYGTVKVYRDVLNKFNRVLGPSIRVEDIDKSTIDSYVHSILESGISAVTANNHIRFLSVAFAWGAENGFISDNPLQRYKRLDSGKDKKPRIFTQEEIRRLLEAAQGRPAWWTDVIRFALNTGIRRKEFLTIKVASWTVKIIDGQPYNFLRVFGKGKKYRDILLNADALEIIQRRAENTTDGLLFGEVKVESISIMFINLKRRTGIDKRFHDLRHTFATNLLRAGVPIEVVQYYLGHGDLRTTQIYAEVTQEQMVKYAENVNRISTAKLE